MRHVRTLTSRALLHKNTVGRVRWTIASGDQAANYANVSGDNGARSRLNWTAGGGAAFLG